MNLEPDFLKILYESCTKPHINMEEWRCQPLFWKILLSQILCYFQ